MSFKKKKPFWLAGPALQSHRVKMMPALLSWAGDKDSYVSGINLVSLVLKKKNIFIDSFFFAGLALVRISTVKSLNSTEDYV